MEYPFRIRFHPRARRVKLKVLRDASLEVVAPPGTSERLIRRFVDANHDWVDSTRARMPIRRSDGPEAGPFPEVLRLRALDQAAVVTWTDSTRSSFRWRENGVRIGLPRNEADIAHAVLVRALKARAVQQLQPHFHALAGRLDKTVGRVTWRNQKTRWGSCSSNGNISLNVRLLFLPPQLVDYVFAHELAHLDHPNHSARFWSALEAMLPGAREHRRAIRDADRLLPDWLVR
ncbi:MAG: SprT family zinc-dependent metalloprotease [Wenzhouxiangellaceae bacterium]